MESKAKLFGHAIHPILIVYPLGLLSTAVIFDIIYLATGNLTWATVSFWMIAAGIIGGLLAAVFGLIDLVNIPNGTRAKRIGLVHGLGFAGFLGNALLAERSKLVPLAAFNLGVELGQVLVVALLAGLLALMPRSRHDERVFLAPPWLRRAGSAAVLVLGLFWFVQRI